MQIYILNQYEYLIKSLGYGILLGIIYDTLNIFSLLFNKKWTSFISDFLFMTLNGIGAIILSFDANGGIYRIYSFVGCALTFYFYKKTIGKLIEAVEKKIIFAIKDLFIAIFRKMYNAIDIFVKFVKINIKKRRSKSYYKKIKKSILKEIR